MRPHVVLLHGFGSDRMSWLANVSAIEAVAAVDNLDLPGHGASDMEVGDGRVVTLAEQMAALFDARGWSGVHLVGHSLGGGIALLLAQARPDLVASLLLIAPAGLGDGVDPVFLTEFAELSQPAETETLLRRLVVQPRLISRHLVTRVLEQLDRPGARPALRKIAAGIIGAGDALAEAARGVVARDTRRMVVWGERDGINSMSAERLAAFAGRVTVVPDAGHLPHVERSGRVNADIVTFLTS